MPVKYYKNENQIELIVYGNPVAQAGRDFQGKADSSRRMTRFNRSHTSSLYDWSCSRCCPIRISHRLIKRVDCF